MYEVWLVTVDKEGLPKDRVVKLLTTESITDALGYTFQTKVSPSHDIAVLNLATGNWVDPRVK
jgi:hypothetical protein